MTIYDNSESVSLDRGRRAELDRLVAEQAADLEYLERVDRDAPLASSILWTLPRGSVDEHGRPRVDQRGSVLAAMTAPTVAVIQGGERSGKSRGQREALFATALGGDHPHVQQWLRNNRLPLDRIPPGPGEVYALALDHNASRKVLRPKYADLAQGLPHVWTNERNKGEGTLEIKVPGTRKRAKVHFLAVEQGPDAMQSISLRAVGIDEEPWSAKGLAVYRHLRGRVADQDGWVSICVMPSRGFTWVHDMLIRDREDDAVVVELDALDNPHTPERRMRRHYGSMSEDEQQMRQRGRYRSPSGSIYPLWFPGADLERGGPGNVCEPFEIPPDWPTFRAGDFGLDNATCIGWGAIGDDGTRYITHELYIDGCDSYDDAAEQAVEFDDRAVSGSWGDPAAKEARERFAAHGMDFEPANNDLQTGYDLMRDLMRLRDDARPRLKVFSTCPNTIAQLGGLRRDQKKVAMVQVKVDDHAADMVRYMVVGMHEWESGVGRLEDHLAGVEALLGQRGSGRGRRR